jgi:hypothetical protein
MGTPIWERHNVEALQNDCILLLTDFLFCFVLFCFCGTGVLLNVETLQ